MRQLQMSLTDLEQALCGANEERASLQESNRQLREKCQELGEQYEAIKGKDDERLALIVDLKAEVRRLGGDRYIRTGTSLG
jgi:chromosome segregation ATPase